MRRSTRMGAGWLVLALAATSAASASPHPTAQVSPMPRSAVALTSSGPDDWLSALESGLRPNVLPAGQTRPGWSLAERMRHYNVPGVAIAIISQGELVRSVGYGTRQAGTMDRVDGDTLFSVGSVSKVVTASTTLRLVAQQRLDLDRTINDYLERWTIPPAEAAPDATVTLRMLMSHTAGLGTPGFQDYQPADALPTLLQVLEGEPPAKGSAVRFRNAPGRMQDYSGGGVTVEQLVLEDVSRRSLEDLARTEVFAPLGMRRSTFESPLSASRGNIAHAHDAQGAQTALPRGWESFAETGASGLWTSANDLGRLVSALINSYQGRSDFLPQLLATDMMTEVSPSAFGLGPKLSVGGTAMSGAGRCPNFNPALFPPLRRERPHRLRIAHPGHAG